MQLGEYKSFLQRSVGLHNMIPSIFQKLELLEMNVKSVMVTDIKTIFILLAKNKSTLKSLFLINR